MVEDFFIKKGSRLPYYEAILRDHSGAIDLGGALTYFSMKNLSTSVVKISLAAAVLTSGVTGGVEYRWAVGDTDTPGEYGVEFRIEGAAGAFTVPLGFEARVTVEDVYA